MIRVSVSRADATVTETETLTAGRVGLECGFTFTTEWDGLMKVAVFEGAETIEVALGVATVAVVPPECMATPGYALRVGVYGLSPANAIVIPTVWAKAGKIKDSSAPDDESFAPATPELVAQILGASQDALNIARGVEERANNGEFDGTDGVSPTVRSQRVEDGVEISITDVNGTTEAKLNDGTNGVDGVSPGITITDIEGGHRVTITDAEHPQGQTFDVMDGEGGSGGSSRTLLGEVAISGATIIHIQSIDYDTGIVTVDDTTMIPEGRQAYTGCKFRLKRLDATAKLNTLPPELLNSSLGATKLSDTTLYFETGSAGSITSYTQEATHDLSKWVLEYHPNGAGYMEIVNFGMSSFPAHMYIELYSPGAALRTSTALTAKINDSNNNNYLGHNRLDGLRAYFGGDSYLALSYRAMPITNGTLPNTSVKGCAAPAFYAIDLQKRGDLVIVRSDTILTVCQNTNSIPCLTRDVNAAILIDNGLSKIRIDADNGFSSFQDGSYLKVWEVND